MDTARRFLAGAALLGRGLGMLFQRPGLLALGLVPAVITGILFLAAFGTLLYFISDVAAVATWFADDWSAGWRGAIRFVAAVGILGVTGLIGIVLFTTVTLLIGDPFYEKISEAIDEQAGGVPGAVEPSFWRALRRNLADSLRLLLFSVLVGIPLFAAGFIPAVGQTVVPVIGALIGGWFLVLELVGIPFARRGLRLADRRRVLGAQRATALGFGVTVFLCFLVPFGAILIMPAAVAGATLLTRRVLQP